MRFDFLLLALVLPLSLPSVAAESSATLDRIRTRGVITMGYMPDAVPFSFLGSDQQPQGYAVDLCREVALGIQAQLKLAKLDTRWVPLTIQNRLDAVKNGSVDIECSTTTWTLSRNASVDFSLITFVDGGSILARANTQYGRLQDFEGRRVAVISGTTTEKMLRSSFAQRKIRLDVVPVSARVDGLKLLDDGGVSTLR